MCYSLLVGTDVPTKSSCWRTVTVDGDQHAEKESSNDCEYGERCGGCSRRCEREQGRADAHYGRS